MQYGKREKQKVKGKMIKEACMQCKKKVYKDVVDLYGSEKLLTSLKIQTQGLLPFDHVLL
jgi:hypothetical protein